MLTSVLAGVVGGGDGSEPALKEVLWNNVKKGKTSVVIEHHQRLRWRIL